MGSACQRSRCPNDCSGRGQCLTITDLGRLEGNDYASRPGRGGDGIGPVYDNWDGDHVTSCNCDFGFFGADCSLRMCPKADDPITVGQDYRSINIRVTSNGAL